MSDHQSLDQSFIVEQSMDIMPKSWQGLAKISEQSSLRFCNCKDLAMVYTLPWYDLFKTSTFSRQISLGIPTEQEKS